MEGLEELADFIQPEKLEAFKEVFPKHFAKSSSIYGKFDNLAKELGHEKPEDVSTVDHFTSLIQDFKTDITAKTGTLSDFEKKMQAFEEKNTQWGEIEGKYKNELEETKGLLSKKDAEFANMLISTQIEGIKFADIHESDRADIIEFQLSKLSKQYEPRFEDGKVVPYKDGKRLVIDGSAVTYSDILTDTFGKYAAKPENKEPEIPNDKTPRSGGGGSAIDACKAARIIPNSAEGIKFLHEYKKQK